MVSLFYSIVLNKNVFLSLLMNFCISCCEISSPFCCLFNMSFLCVHLWNPIIWVILLINIFFLRFTIWDTVFIWFLSFINEVEYCYFSLIVYVKVVWNYLKLFRTMYRFPFIGTSNLRMMCLFIYNIWMLFCCYGCYNFFISVQGIDCEIINSFRTEDIWMRLLVFF